VAPIRVGRVSSRRPHVPEQLWDDVLAGSELVARGLRALGARGAWPPVLIASALAVALTTWAWTALPLRPAVTTWFLLVCPGMALVRLLPPRDRLLSLVLAAALSLTLETLLAEMTLLAGVWSPGALLTLLIVVTVAASVMDLPSVRHHVESAAATGWSRIAVRESTEDGAT